MRAIGVYEFGGPDVLRVVDLPEPHAGPGEVRVRVRAAAVNPADTLLRSGVLAQAFAGVPAPYVPGMDIAGVIDEIGPGTETELSPGEPVMAMVIPLGPAAGGYAEYVVLPAGWVVRAPAGIDHAAAATLPMNGLTALLALDQLALAPGSVLAVIGAAGALGGYLVQLGRHAGLTVVADAAPADEALVRRSGAADVVARGSDVAERIRARYPDGVDAVADAALVGPDLLDAVRDGGAYTMFRSGAEPGGHEIDGGNRITVQKTFVPDYAGRTDKLNQIRRLAEAGVLIPRVATTLPAAEAADAHRRLEAGGVRGRSCSPSDLLTSPTLTDKGVHRVRTFRRESHPDHRRHLRHGPCRRRAARGRGREGRPGRTRQGGRRRAGGRHPRRRSESHLRTPDVTVEAEAAELVRQAVERYGRLDGAFNNVGAATAVGPVTDVDGDAWHADLALNLSSVFFGLKHQIPALRAAGGGAIVNNASNLGVTGAAGMASYSAAKHGVVGLTRSAALDTAAAGIRINALITGGVDTPLLRARHGPDPGGVPARGRGDAPGRADRPAGRDRGVRGVPAERRSQVHHRSRARDRRRADRRLTTDPYRCRHRTELPVRSPSADDLDRRLMIDDERPNFISSIKSGIQRPFCWTICANSPTFPFFS